MNIYIDSENVSHDSFNEIRNYYFKLNKEILSIKVFNDWTLNTGIKWNKLCRNFSLDQIQCQKRKNSVDFSIITNIIDDMIIDDFTSNKITNILIVSSDTDYINVTNRVRKTGRVIDVYSPHFKNSMYTRQNSLFINNGYDINQDILNDEYQNSYPIPTEAQIKLIKISDSDTDKELYINDSKRSIIIAFRWYNSNKKPFRRINLQEFLMIYKKIVNLNIVKNHIKCEKDLYKYKDCIKIIKDEEQIEYIEFTGNEQIYKKYYIFCIESVYDDITTCFNYNQCEKTPFISLKHLFNNIYLLLHKNILHTKRDHILEIIKTSNTFQFYLKNNKCFFKDKFFVEGDFIFIKDNFYF